MDFCKYCKLSVGGSPETTFFECVKCGSIAHLKCVIDKPLLLCDVFYNYTCEKCSKTKRMFLKRHYLTWNCVMVLVLYNLKHNMKTPCDRKGYYHWKMHIFNFIDKHWSAFFGSKKKPRLWQRRISGALQNSSVLFKSGNEELGELGWWQLKSPYWPQKILDDYKLKKTTSEELAASGGQGVMDSHDAGDCLSLLNTDVYDYTYLRNNTYETDLNIECFSNWDMLLPEPLINTYDSSSSVPNCSDASSTPPINFQDKLSSGDEGDKSEEDSDSDKQQRLGKRRRKMSNSHKLWPWETKRDEGQVGSFPMSEYEELVLLKQLAHTINEADSSSVPGYILRFYRKLVVRKAKRERNLPLFSLTSQGSKETTHCSTRILDRYQNLLGSQHLKQNSFLVDIGIKCETQWNTSPYTHRVLKPYIRVDCDTLPSWLRLMNDIMAHKGHPACRRHPITYSYVEARHIPSVNMLCALYFWPGVDLSECLQYPDFSCIVEYKRLVIGFAFMVPNVTHTEAYISFIFTRPEWRNAGIATFMLYHLIHTCMGKDVTLHVSATNPALMLYQKFGFKVEQFVQDFYDKYLPHNSKECRHAVFLRLSR